MEFDRPLDSEILALELTPESRGYILETAKWARFLAIVGFVFIGLFLILFLVGGAFFATAFSELDELNGGAGMIGGGFFTAYMLTILAITFFPIYYLYIFSTRTIRAVNSSSTEDLTDGLKNLKSFFKFYGIFTAIFVGLYAIALVLALLGGAFAAFS